MNSATTLALQLDEQLTQRATSLPDILVLDGGTHVVRLEVVHADQLACVIDSLSVSAKNGTQFPPADLRQRADGIASRLTYLLEPIRVHEHDAAASSVQLRSYPPTRDAQNSVRYHELQVNRSGLSLVRYEKTSEASRRQIGMTLTREVLLRLMSDLVA
jgi:hypothetical protein